MKGTGKFVRMGVGRGKEGVDRTKGRYRCEWSGSERY